METSVLKLTYKMLKWVQCGKLEKRGPLELRKMFWFVRVLDGSLHVVNENGLLWFSVDGIC